MSLFGLPQEMHSNKYKHAYSIGTVICELGFKFKEFREKKTLFRMVKTNCRTWSVKTSNANEGNGMNKNSQ